MVGVGVTDLKEGNVTTKGPRREAEFGVPQNSNLIFRNLNLTILNFAIPNSQ